MSRSQKLQTVSNKASVTGMVLTSDKQRLVTSGLDKSVTVYSIIRKNGVPSISFRSSTPSSPKESSATKNLFASCSLLCFDQKSCSVLGEMAPFAS